MFTWEERASGRVDPVTGTEQTLLTDWAARRGGAAACGYWPVTWSLSVHGTVREHPWTYRKIYRRHKSQDQEISEERLGYRARVEVSPCTTMFCAKYITLPHNFDRVFRLQKNAVRVIFNLNHREPCRRDAFRYLGFFTLPSIYIMKFITNYKSKFTMVRVWDIYQ